MSESASSSNKLDQSLGDIITSTKKQRGGRTGGRGGGTFRRGGAAPRQQNGNSGPRRRNPLDRAEFEEEEFDDSASAGPVRRGRQQFRNSPYSRADSGSWSHDMFASQAPVEKVTTVGQTTVMGDTVFVSNLATDITDDDLLEIFGRIGSILRANVNFNSQAQSLGTAEVQFGSNQLAESAVKELDGAQVDGRTMQVKLVATVQRPRTIVQRTLPPPQPRPQPRQQQQPYRQPRTVNSGGGGGRNLNRGGGGGGGSNAPRRNSGTSRGGGGGGRGGRQQQKPVTSADLDAELDSYQASRGVAASSAAPAAAAAAE